MTDGPVLDRRHDKRAGGWVDEARTILAVGCMCADCVAKYVVPVRCSACERCWRDTRDPTGRCGYGMKPGVAKGE